MDAPFGILFLKKAEIYTIINNLDKRKKEIDKDVDDPDSPSEVYSTWPVEKQILKWSYWGHKYLKHPIKISHFTDPKPNGAYKLKDFKLCIDNNYKNKEDWLNKDTDKLEYEYQKIIGKNKKNCDELLFDHENNKLNIKSKAVQHVFENIVIRGYSNPCYKSEKYKNYNNQLNYKQDENLYGIIINNEGLLLGEVLYKIDKCKTHLIYSIFSHLMQHFGAWVFLLIFIFTLIVTPIVNHFDFWKEFFREIINFLNSLFQSLLSH